MRGIEKLHPELQPICREFVNRCVAAGLNVLITETLRTEAEQTALYAQGRTRPGAVVTRCRYPKSPHCWGVAFDFCRNEKGREYANEDGFFEKCGAVGKRLGLTWGGDWKNFVDRPHLELTKFMPSASCGRLIQTYGTPENFIRTWPDATEETAGPEEEKMTVYKNLDDLPRWGRSAVERLMEKGVVRGNSEGELNLSEDLLRMCVMLDRLSLR